MYRHMISIVSVLTALSLASAACAWDGSSSFGNSPRAGDCGTSRVNHTRFAYEMRGTAYHLGEVHKTTALLSEGGSEQPCNIRRLADAMHCPRRQASEEAGRIPVPLQWSVGLIRRLLTVRKWVGRQFGPKRRQIALV